MAAKCSGRPAAASPFNGVAEQCRSAIGETLGERGVITSGILIEQPAHIRFAHRRRGIAGPEPGKLQAGAVIVLRIGIAGFFERGDGAGAVAEPVADGAERKPCGREAGRQLHGLRKNVRGAGKIAARGMVERPFVAAVGDQIAGRDEKRAGVGHDSIVPGGAGRSRTSITTRLRKHCKQPRFRAPSPSGMSRSFIYSPCVLKTSWCRRRPAYAASSALFISIRRGRSSAR